MKLLGISGSLRRASLNRALLLAAGELLPEGVTLTVAEIRELPFYDGDIDDDEHRPDVVRGLKRSIVEADALLIVTPEYNYGIPGGLKNAIDWVSRPAYRSPLRGKPVAIMSASPGLVGGVRAQAHLKQVLLGVVAEVFPYPEVNVGAAHTKLVDGKLVDEDTRTQVRGMLAEYVRWAQRGRAG